MRLYIFYLWSRASCVNSLFTFLIHNSLDQQVTKSRLQNSNLRNSVTWEALVSSAWSRRASRGSSVPIFIFNILIVSHLISPASGTSLTRWGPVCWLFAMICLIRPKTLSRSDQLQLMLLLATLAAALPVELVVKLQVVTTLMTCRWSGRRSPTRSSNTLMTGLISWSRLSRWYKAPRRKWWKR